MKIINFIDKADNLKEWKMKNNCDKLDKKCKILRRIDQNLFLVFNLFNLASINGRPTQDIKGHYNTHSLDWPLPSIVHFFISFFI